MDREKLFEDYFRECRIEPIQFCGQGEKNSDILIVGKESTKVSVAENHELCKNERGGYIIPRDEDKKNDTWCNYQTLIDYVYEGIKPPKPERKWDFEKYAFTTELNPRESKRTSHPDEKTRDAIAERLKLFRKSDFIQTFPVVILACSDYIVNQGVGEERQIDTTFGVKYCPHKETPTWFTPYNWFFIHRGEYIYHGETIKKLVIHTRNLSQNLKRELLPSMAQVIREHLNIK